MFDHIAKKPRMATPSKALPSINIYVSLFGDISQQHINRAGSPSPKENATSANKEGKSVLVLSN